jgi:hypothetical protein
MQLENFWTQDIFLKKQFFVLFIVKKGKEHLITVSVAEIKEIW